MLGVGDVNPIKRKMDDKKLEVIINKLKDNKYLTKIERLYLIRVFEVQEATIDILFKGTKK